MSEVCRAITFINYHIPYREHEELDFNYTTLGFFDGMDTKALSVDYAKEGLFALWQYILERTAKSNGLYSYQNIFCFSDDNWNSCTDNEFWSLEADKKFPLTFVSFLQLRDYSIEHENIRERCIKFSNIINTELNGNGKVYAYSTIDKNDYVICMKCSNYQKAVEIIQKIHHAKDTIYSYTVFSVLNGVLEELDSLNYKGLFQQILPSICLKGVANSYDPLRNVTLDKRYYNFCMQLVSCIYHISKDELEEKQGKIIEDADSDMNGKKQEILIDYKIYDILGDDDFRLIVRNVNLGRLMKQFSSEGMLSYRSNNFRFYLFSSNLILNTATAVQPVIEDQYQAKTIENMKATFRPPKCEAIENSMEKIKEIIFYGSFANEKILSFCHAIWQLIQSMKALETAPTKKYDFLSLYYPLKSFVEILESKMSLQSENEIKLLEENEEIFEFIHKISMTIHGTLRTDIQFFQIRDFNAIVHYAPAKVRAFYTLWTLKIKDYYNQFINQEETNQYAFIFSPGMFSGTSVQQLFTQYTENHRLMLITVPERHLYAPKWLTIVLAHETSHFVGWKIRNRAYRQEIWVECCAKTFLLEIRKFLSEICQEEYKKMVLEYCNQNHRFEEIFSLHFLKAVKQRIEGEPLWPHQFHSENSFLTIGHAFYDIGDHVEKACEEECERIINYIINEQELNKKPYADSVKESKNVRLFMKRVAEQMIRFYGVFGNNYLGSLLGCLRYISSEVYADLNAILTLNLTPCDYLASFFSCELEKSYLEKYNRDFDMLLPYRIALSMKTIIDVLNGTEKGKWLSNGEKPFYESWPADIFDTLPKKFEYGSVEAKLAIECRAVSSKLVDYGKNIQEYKGAYQVNEREFDLNKTTLFTDKVIWDNLLLYMKKCVEDYLSELKDQRDLYTMKKELVSTYSEISGISANQMLQEIENFLEVWEQEM